MSNDVRLRGNTFILLLLRAGNDDLSANGGWGTKGNGVTKPNMFLDLLKMIKPAHSPNMNTLAQYFSSYMDGSRPNSDTAYPFSSPAFCDLFKKRMTEEYGAVLIEMDNFCKKYIDYKDNAVRRQLVAGVIIGLAKDTTIGGNAEFETGYGKIQKAQFNATFKFKLQPFLLSVWYYLVTRKPNVAEAIETYKEWTGEAEPNTAPPITTKIGLQHAENIEVEFDETINPKAESPYQEDFDETMPDIEQEILDDEPTSSSNAPLNKPIIHQIVMNFNAPVQNVNPNATTVTNTTNNYYYNGKGPKQDE